MSATSANTAPPHGAEPGFWEHLLRGLRMALVLTAVTQLLHAMHLEALASFDHRFTSAVVSRLLQHESIEERPAARHGLLAVQQLEIGADLRMLALEAGHVDAATIRRLDGVRPIDRRAMAELLQQLAQCLGDGERCIAAGARPRVLAIDVDLAPLTKDDASARPAMLAALKALRQHLAVVVIALDRGTDTERLTRNAFMMAAGCSLADGSVAGSEPPAQPHGLYFASSRLMQREHEGPLYYLSKAKQPGDLSPLFPALGQLAHLAASPEALTADGKRSLTHLCAEAKAGPSQLTEDRMNPADAPGYAVHQLEARYERAYFNWPLLYSEALRFTPLSWDGDGRWTEQLQAQLREHRLQAPILMLSVDGGAGNDRFATPGALARPVGGATLHALQALSLQQPLKEASWQGALADLLLGAGFVLLACMIHVYLLGALHHHLPGLTRLVLATTSVVLALLFSWLGVVLAGWLMSRPEHPLWFNPMYVVLGMALHAFLEGWSSGSPPDHRAKLPQRGLLARVFLQAAAPLDSALDARLRLFGYWALMLAGVVALAINSSH